MGFAASIGFDEVGVSENDRKSHARKTYEFAHILRCWFHGPEYREVFKPSGVDRADTTWK